MASNGYITEKNRFVWTAPLRDMHDRMAVRRRLNDLQCDPITVLAAIMSGVDPDTGNKDHEITPELRAICAKTLLEYSHPKLRQVDHTVDTGGAVNVVVIGNVLDKDAYDKKQIEGKK